MGRKFAKFCRKAGNEMVLFEISRGGGGGGSLIPGIMKQIINEQGLS